jgi:hypothetical protein
VISYPQHTLTIVNNPMYTFHMDFNERNCDIRVAYAKGVRQTYLAKKYKVSRQRIWQIVHPDAERAIKIKNKTHVAFAQCKECFEIFKSKHGGDFKQCSCGQSFIDQERWDARHVRIGGNAIFIKQECPPGCKVHTK